MSTTASSGSSLTPARHPTRSAWWVSRSADSINSLRGPRWVHNGPTTSDATRKASQATLIGLAPECAPRSPVVLFIGRYPRDRHDVSYLSHAKVRRMTNGITDWPKRQRRTKARHLGTEKRDLNLSLELKIGGTRQESNIEGSKGCHPPSFRPGVTLPVSNGPAGRGRRRRTGASSVANPVERGKVGRGIAVSKFRHPDDRRSLLTRGRTCLCGRQQPCEPVCAGVRVNRTTTHGHNGRSARPRGFGTISHSPSARTGVHTVPVYARSASIYSRHR